MSDKLVRIKNRYDTASNWKSNNPVLAAGEIGIDSTYNWMKVGDGKTSWNDITPINDGIPMYFLKYGESYSLYDAFFKNFGKMKNSTYIDMRIIIVQNKEYANNKNNEYIGNGNDGTGIPFLNSRATCYDTCPGLYIPYIKGTILEYDNNTIVTDSSLLKEKIPNTLYSENKYMINVKYFNINDSNYVTNYGIPIYNSNGEKIGSIDYELSKNLFSTGNLKYSEITGLHGSGGDVIYIGNPPDVETNECGFNYYFYGIPKSSGVHPYNIDSNYYYNFRNKDPFLEEGVNIICVNKNGEYEVNLHNPASALSNRYNSIISNIQRSIDYMHGVSFYNYEITNNYITSTDDGTGVFDRWVWTPHTLTGDWLIKLSIPGYSTVTIYSTYQSNDNKYYFYSLTDANQSIDDLCNYAYIDDGDLKVHFEIPGYSDLENMKINIDIEEYYGQSIYNSWRE